MAPKICFFFNFVKSEEDLVCRLLKEINLYHPNDLVIAISEGETNFTPSHNNLILVEGEALKYKNIGHFTTRNLSCVLNLNPNFDYLIKLDPDTFVRKTITSIPDVDWGGQINSGIFSWGFSSWCRGGGFFIKREAIQKILDSNLLLHPRYNVREIGEVDKLYEDCRLGHVANSLNIFPTNWSQVLCAKLNCRDVRHKNAALLHRS